MLQPNSDCSCPLAILGSHTLYDTVLTDDDSITFVNLSSGSASSFDMDMEQGAIDGKTGVCVDLDSSMNEGCSNRQLAAAKDGIIGCADGFVSKFMCGLSVDVRLLFRTQSNLNSTSNPCFRLRR